MNIEIWLYPFIMHYFIDDNSNHYKKLFLSAEKNRNKDRMKFYIVLNRDLIKKIQLNK